MFQHDSGKCVCYYKVLRQKGFTLGNLFYARVYNLDFNGIYLLEEKTYFNLEKV